MPRKHQSAKARAGLFKAKSGVCHICHGPIGRGEAWDVSHPIPLELGGADDESNWDIAHRKCHRDVTKTDVANIARAKRREQKHVMGIRKRSTFANSRDGKFKTKIGGRTELR